MKDLKDRIALILAAFWWGSLTTIGFLVVPMLFAKLGNPSFAEKAPPPVVEQARRLLAETEARHADLRGQLGKLG